ncbi:hypothetical protein [Cribrihabitans pelagius]|uniref:hypothetical protein n=1 Tax=Cribrihabitans pelagius TaxID=1765746 RepID=UPI003B5C6D31
MRKPAPALIAAAAAITAPATAQADAGAHLHPHAAESWLAAAALSGLCVPLAAMALRRVFASRRGRHRAGHRTGRRS